GERENGEGEEAAHEGDCRVAESPSCRVSERLRREPLGSSAARLLAPSPLDNLQERADLSVDCLGESMAEPTTDILQGTLDLLILKTLSFGDQHGWGIAQRIQQVSRDVLQINQ